MFKIILSGVFIGIPLSLILSYRTVISSDLVMNVFLLIAVVCCLIIIAVKRRQISSPLLYFTVIFGIAPLLLGFLLLLNWLPFKDTAFIEQYKVHKYTSAGYQDILVTFENNEYEEMTRLRTFDISEMRSDKSETPDSAIYTMRPGLLGYKIIKNKLLQ